MKFKYYLLFIILMLFIMPVQAWQIEYNDINHGIIGLNDRENNIIYWNNSSHPIYVLYEVQVYGAGYYYSGIFYINDTYVAEDYMEPFDFDFYFGRSIFVPAYSSYQFLVETDKINLIYSWYEWNITDDIPLINYTINATNVNTSIIAGEKIMLYQIIIIIQFIVFLKLRRLRQSQFIVFFVSILIYLLYDMEFLALIGSGVLLFKLTIVLTSILTFYNVIIAIRNDEI